MFESFFSSIKRSWSLMKKSYEVLMLDKELMVFPLVASFFGILTFIPFIIPLVVFENISDILFYIGLFGFYLVSYFITIFFNTALIGAANIRLNGGDPTISDGLNIAFKRLVPILGWTLVAATVGLILNTLARKFRNNAIGRFIIGLVGGAWNIITFFVVPVLAIEGTGPLESIKKSTDIVKTKFSETIIGGLGFGLIQGLIIFAAIIAGAILVLGLGSILGSIGFIIGILAAVLLIALFSIFMSALNSIFVAALYNYAKTGNDPQNWNLSGVVQSIKK